MSLNWVMLDATREPVPLPHERLLSTDTPGNGDRVADDRAVCLCRFTPKPIRIPVCAGLTSSTRLHQTRRHDRSQRQTRVALSAMAICAPTSFVQPYFAANYLSMDVKPAPDGGLELGTRVEVRLSDQGMFEFIKRVENTRARAIEKAREARLGDPLRE
ncbi:hypothetical protein RhiLY_01341 [Ceratobasidium sp. AG-Ba]|nr:hypothetical protein RhiLY_01341 [Ceratobasidium sp. AG-Ba]